MGELRAGSGPRVAPRALWLVALLGLATFTPAARGNWRRSTEINTNTAFTLEQGMVEVGFLAPLTVGITDEFQAALHPILLLLGQPYVALRWRITRPGPVTVALNLGASWSFIRREDEQGQAASETDPDSGFPGTTHATATVTFRAGEDWLFSVGGGPGADFLGTRTVRGLAELHASIHWRPDPRQVLMVQASGYLDLDASGALTRPVLSLVYGFALTDVVYLAGGVGFGDFVFEPDEESRKTLHVFPIVDVGFRL